MNFLGATLFQKNNPIYQQNRPTILIVNVLLLRFKSEIAD